MNILKKISPLLVVFAAVVAYSGSFSGVFVFDDYIWIVNNNDIRSFWSSISGSSRPLIGFSFYLNYLTSGLRVADYHAFNLLVHVSAGLLLFGILNNTLKLHGDGSRHRGNSTLIALMISLVWVVHPLNTESVTYIVQRSESLMGMFYLLTLYCFIRGIRSDVGGDRWLTGGIIACALGMTCKPVMVTAPVIVLLYDRTFVSGSFAEALKRRRLAYAGLAATWVILFALLSVPNESSSSAGFHALTLSPLNYLITQAGVLLHYMKLVFWPVNLCLDYDWPPAGISVVTLLQMAVVALFAAFSLLLFYRENAAGFAGIVFLILLFPSSGIVPLSDCAAEHRMYLPLICAVLLVFMAADGLLRRIYGDLPCSSKCWAVLLSLTAVLVAWLSVLTIESNRIYQSEESIWRNVVFLRPDNLRGYLGLGSCLLRNAQNKQAESYFIRIIGDQRFADKKSYPQLMTELSMAYNNLGVIRFQDRGYREAEEFFKKSLEAGFSADAQRNLNLVRGLLPAEK